jgi:hypothetical protein
MQGTSVLQSTLTVFPDFSSHSCKFTVFVLVAWQSVKNTGRWDGTLISSNPVFNMELNLMLYNSCWWNDGHRLEDSSYRDLQPQTPAAGHIPNNGSSPSSNSATACSDPQEKMLSVSGKKKCSHCGEELGKFLRSAFCATSLFFSFAVYKCTRNSHAMKS